MNTFPCPQCERPNECRKDRHCNRPRTLIHAMDEAREAAQSFDAASKRLTEALAGLLAVMAIEKSGQ